MLRLHKLKPSKKKKKRIGRGGARGGTSTRGHKGQKARSGGGVRVAFEGGQMPLYRRLPKRGFTNIPFKQEVKIISLKELDNTFDEGVTVTKETLVEKGLLKLKKGKKGKKEFAIKILGDGSLSKKLTIHADAFSASARKAIESAGGQALLTKEN